MSKHHNQPPSPAVPATSGLVTNAPAPGSAFAAHQQKMIDQARRIKDGVVAKPPVVLSEDADAKTPMGPTRLICSNRACQTSFDMTGQTLEYVAVFASTHGFIRDENNKLFCSHRCVMLTPDAKPTPRTRDKHAAIGHAPTHVTVRNGQVHCDYKICEGTLSVTATATVTAAKIAAVNGWTQTGDGTFCSVDCAKRARADVAAGLHVTPNAAITGPDPRVVNV